MSNRDNSHAALMKRRAGQAIAQNLSVRYDKAFPAVGALTSAALTTRDVGAIAYTRRTDDNTVITTEGCGCAVCPTQTAVENINVTLNSTGPFLTPYDWAASRYLVTWSPIEGSTYNVTCTNEYYQVAVQYTGGTSAYIYFNAEFIFVETITITATTSCGTLTGTYSFPPCFLAGSTVAMADGTSKAIESVAIGEKVVGAFGEINTVLALHRPFLGPAVMLRINGEHSTSAHHPHIGADRKIYSFNPKIVENALNNRKYPVINAEGKTVLRDFTGLSKGRLQKLVLGVELKTLGGSKTVMELKEYRLPPTTQLYNLVLDGSHTYHVDGYAVTGWPREDDFDYDTWTPRSV